MTLSLEEVLRQHRSQKGQSLQEGDANLRRLRAEHLKSRGDEAIKQGNYRLAWERYSEAIAAKPDKEGLHALYSNRSMAYFKAQRYSEALQDAENAARLAPGWQKAHWRRATALLALKQVPEAVLAYREAWRLDRRDTEGQARLWQAVQRLTREQLAQGFLHLLSDLEQEGKVEAPQVEAVSEQEQIEALFRLLKSAHQGQPKPGPYYHRYLKWLQEGLSPGEAYLERAALHTSAKCYLQARADAQAAVAALIKEPPDSKRQQQQQQQQQQQWRQRGDGSEDEGDSAPSELAMQLALAYQRLGEACMAEPKHEDRDCFQAAKAFLKCLELDPGRSEVHEALQQASQELSIEQLDQVQVEVYHEGVAGAAHGGTSCSSPEPSSDLAGPRAGRPAAGQRVFRVALQLAFPAAKAADCTHRVRELLRAGVARAARVNSLSVSIERVLAPSAATRHLSILMHVHVGAELLKGNTLVKSVQSCIPDGSSGSGDSSGSSGQPAGCPEAEQQQTEEQQRQQQPARQGAILGAVEQTQAAGSPMSIASQQQAAPSPGPATPARAESAGQAQAEEQPPLPLLPTPQQQEQLADLVGGEQVIAALGHPDHTLCSAELDDITPACAASSEAERAQQEAVNRGEVEVPAEKDRRLVVPSRPKLELELPYRLYRLVRADGNAVERVDKHPFCMSRVYYDATEKPEEVWAELADGSCRWRQTGGEVKVLALKVPSDLPPKRLGVEIEPYSLKVWDRSRGEVYLEGRLERGVVPEDCYWTHCGGEGEEGCALYLRKMNLELLQKHWMHSEMWWPRLFRHHADIAWDDYEKDYSDLPEEVLERHRVAEAIKDVERQAETSEKTKRESLQESNDMRKRARQERLNELRTGTKLSWVQLNRMLPAAAGT